jgi:branched-chain amino acid transport system ATP-binding protein
MKEILSIQSLSAGYGPLRVIHDLDLVVRTGEKIGLIGLNGHGKSTLMRAIAGLTDWQDGSIRLLDKEIGGRRMHGAGRRTHRIVRQGLSLMPQGDALFPGLTVRQHLDSGAYTSQAWRTREERRARVLDIFPALKPRLNDVAGRLSGGERRMVSLGRGLMADVKLYLIDEPSLGLAPIVSKTVIDALMQIDLKDGAMIIAEQIVSLLEGRVERVLGMHDGRIKAGEVDLNLGKPVMV